MGQVKATPHFQVTSGSLNDLGRLLQEILVNQEAVFLRKVLQVLVL
jgi:hypothetical protein